MNGPLDKLRSKVPGIQPVGEAPDVVPVQVQKQPLLEAPNTIKVTIGQGPGAQVGLRTPNSTVGLRAKTPHPGRRQKAYIFKVVVPGPEERSQIQALLKGLEPATNGLSQLLRTDPEAYQAQLEAGFTGRAS